MDKTQLKRHDMVFVSPQGKDRIWYAIADAYTGAARELVRDVLKGKTDIPGFVRRGDGKAEEIALGFVHYRRLDGNRIRIGAFITEADINTVMTPYDVLQRSALTCEAKSPCVKAIVKLYGLAEIFDLQIGVLGSAALEMLTNLPYTDENSDLDLLIKPAPYDKLLQFYRAAQIACNDLKMDFEVDLPNGYGVKLSEVFMDTQTVLGKSLDDVNLLSRKDIMQYLA